MKQNEERMDFCKCHGLPFDCLLKHVAPKRLALALKMSGGNKGGRVWGLEVALVLVCWC